MPKIFVNTTSAKTVNGLLPGNKQKTNRVNDSLNHLSKTIDPRIQGLLNIGKRIEKSKSDTFQIETKIQRLFTSLNSYLDKYEQLESSMSSDASRTNDKMDSKNAVLFDKQTELEKKKEQIKNLLELIRKIIPGNGAILVNGFNIITIIYDQIKKIIDSISEKVKIDKENEAKSAIAQIIGVPDSKDMTYPDSNPKRPEETPPNMTNSSSTNTGNLEGNEKTVAQYLLDKGLSPLQVAAIMGNIEAESRCNPGTFEQWHEGAGDGFGICQWSFDRRKQLEQYAASKGIPASDINIQLDFLWAELTGTGDAAGYASIQYKHNGFLELDNLEEATYFFGRKFERPSEKYAHWDRRIESAQRIYKSLTSNNMDNKPSTAQSDNWYSYSNYPEYSCVNDFSNYTYCQKDYSKFVENGRNVGCTATSEAIAVSILHQNGQYTPDKMGWCADGATWSNSNTIDVSGMSEKERLGFLYDKIIDKTPVVVRTDYYGEHTVVAVGIKNNVDRNSLSQSDILIIDPNDGKVKLLSDLNANFKGNYVRVPK